MNYNQKPSGTGGGGHGGGPPNGPNNQQVAKTLAGIQQQMQNLPPPADINAFLQQQRFQNMLQQHLQQLQMQNKDRGSSGGGEPLALTRTPAAAELLNKTYQQQPNGSAGSNPGLSPFHQQLPNIMQQLQAFQYQFQQHQQHHPQTQPPQHHTQQQQQPQPQLTAQHQQPQLHNQTHQQQKALSTAAAAVQLQIQQNLQQRYLMPGAQSTSQASGGNKISATPPPPLPNQMKPPNLPPSTQITPVPASTSATASGSAIKSQSAPSGSGISAAKQVPPSISLLPAKQPANTPTPTAAHQQSKFGVGKSAPVVSAIPPPFPTHYQKSSLTGGATVSQTASNNSSKSGISEAAVASLKPPQVNPVPLTKPLPTTASNTVNMGVSKQTQPTPALSQPTNSANASQTQLQKVIPTTSAIPPVLSPNPKNNKPPQISDAVGEKTVDTAETKTLIASSSPPHGESGVPALPTGNIQTKIAPPATPMPVDAKSSVNDCITNAIAPLPAKEHIASEVSPVLAIEVADKSATVPAADVKDIDSQKDPVPTSGTSIPAQECDEIDGESKENSMVKAEDNKSNKTNDNNKNEGKSELAKIKLSKTDDLTEIPKQADQITSNAADQNDGNDMVPEKPSESVTALDKEKVSDEKLTNLENNAKINSNALNTTHEEPISDEVQSKENLINTETSPPLLEVEPNIEVIAKEDDKNEPTLEDPQKKSPEKSANKPKEEKSKNAKAEKAALKATTSSTTATIAVANESALVTKPKGTDNEVQQSSEPSVGKKQVRQVKATKTGPAPQAFNENTPDRSEKPSGSRASRGEKRKSKTESTDNSVCLTPSLPATPKETNDPSSDRKSQRHRLKTILYQSPLPELAFITKLSASEASNSPKPMSVEDKLIVFYKNEYMAVRNAEGTFYLCQTMQNVYRSSPRISIRWLSEDAHDSSVYKPDFYDHTDIECVLTTVELKKVDKGHLRLPKAEKARIENILKKAIDVEKGLLPRPELTEENPDGLDISLYKDESQIEKKIPSGSTPVSSSKGRKSRSSKPLEKTPKESGKRKRHSEVATANESTSKQSAKKRTSLIKRKKKSKKSSTSDDESTDGLESDSEYKPNQKKTNAAPTSTPRVQRSPLARARAASPITASTSRGSKEEQATPTSSGRAERATKRKSAVDTAFELPIPSKKGVPKQAAAANVSKSTNSRSKAQENAGHGVIGSNTTAKKSQNHETSGASSTASPSTSPAVAISSTSSSNRPTRSRK